MIAALVSMKLWSLVNACFAIAINNPISSNRVYNFKSLLYDFELCTEFRFLAGFQYWTRFTADSACYVSLLSSEFKHHVTEELRRCWDKNKQHTQRNILYEAVCMKFTYLHVSSQDESPSGAALSHPTGSVQTGGGLWARGGLWGLPLWTSHMQNVIYIVIKLYT